MTRDSVLTVLREVIDPELGVNIVDLGLIEHLIITGTQIDLAILLTSPVCPMGGYIRDQAAQVLAIGFPAAEIDVRLLTMPQWVPERMTSEAKRQVGWGHAQ